MLLKKFTLYSFCSLIVKKNIENNKNGIYSIIAKCKEKSIGVSTNLLLFHSSGTSLYELAHNCHSLPLFLQNPCHSTHRCQAQKISEPE